MSVGIDQTVAHLQNQENTRRERAASRAKYLRRLLPVAARVLRDEYGASEVWLFGSLATGGFHEASDVDLAVEGLRADRLLDAAAAMMRLFPCDVDLVRLEEAPSSLRDDADPAVLARAAWALHHAYTAVESILERVARTVEGSIPEGADWHKALLDDAALEIPSTRPALLTRSTVQALHDLRTFRHFVRGPQESPPGHPP